MQGAAGARLQYSHGATAGMDLPVTIDHDPRAVAFESPFVNPILYTGARGTQRIAPTQPFCSMYLGFTRAMHASTPASPPPVAYPTSLRLSLYEIEVTPSIAEDKLQAKLAGDWAKLKRRRPPSSKPTTSRGHPSPSNHTIPVASGPAVSTKVGIYRYSILYYTGTYTGIFLFRLCTKYFKHQYLLTKTCNQAEKA
jgi:hypothetical protein